MSPPALRLARTNDAPGKARVHRLRRPLGDILVEMGALDPGDLLKALALQGRQNLRLGDILLAHGMVSEGDLLAALSRQYNAQPIDLRASPPDPRLIDAVGIQRCLGDGILPVRRLGGATIIATSRPEHFIAQRRRLPADFGDPIMALCNERDLHRAVIDSRNITLARAAETRVAEDESCRFWYQSGPRNIMLTFAAALLALFVLSPVLCVALLTAWAVFTLAAATGLKALAAGAVWRERRRAAREPDLPKPEIASLPVVSVLVPLFREEDIVSRLIPRLSRLTYPKELLDICLVTEEDDTVTRAMLDKADLPHWMRVITVPRGPLKTKPRALNFALDFCRGTIVGVYDAEDAPAPDQIHRIVRRFHERGPDVACIQGVLDYYNSRANWFARCFTIEYNSWFRLMLPGIAALGLVVPLGGTTLFFRRDVLEELGGWDAHNVTEDADLGVRLARRGYRTELIDSVTEEEANCRLWPWVKQRSRWLKGYAMTWSTHMRRPGLLWRQLGAWRFIGFQIMFLGTLSQFLLVPLLWSLWLVMLGLPHPLTGVLSPLAMQVMSGLFVGAEVLNIAIGMAGTALAGKRYLWAWVPTTHFYFPLAALATYKAVFEMVSKPFYWDKTQHGVSQSSPEAEPAPLREAA
ncbi:glycosyltransferase family 2 protein [Actibacterium ureilyticum]|uniref:glycosyltransferase family 2 protein n=1 Tax=Actibacterium ureilyticum TaxID=1590614 RepID=UPI001FE361EE|nr:glycosyltransferase family 2 protein [Actibacterium ureilyticum]